MERLRRNQQNRADNLAHADNIFVGGIFYRKGVPQISKDKYFKLKDEGKSIEKRWQLIFERGKK